MDLVESEEVFRPALSYALGSALVCDTLEEAQELCFTKGEKVHCTVLDCIQLYCIDWSDTKARGFELIARWVVCFKDGSR